MWVAERLEDPCANTLGQLGGQPANDPSAAPGGGICLMVMAAIFTPQLLVARNSVPLVTFHQDAT